MPSNVLSFLQLICTLQKAILQYKNKTILENDAIYISVSFEFQYKLKQWLDKKSKPLSELNVNYYLL